MPSAMFALSLPGIRAINLDYVLAIYAVEMEASSSLPATTCAKEVFEEVLGARYWCFPMVVCFNSVNKGSC